MDMRGKQRIMVVDDDAGIRVCLQKSLERAGYAVTMADTAEGALTALKNNATAPELVILDLNMPGMGGIGFLRQTAEGGGRFRFPVLVLSARGSARAFLESAGVVTFISKPCSETSLLAKVRDLIPMRAQTPSVADDNGMAHARASYGQYYQQVIAAHTRLSQLCMAR